ncbi:sulfate/molybdate ABC transporter ATP-binding protein [Fodinicola acaciae]|uniref:sulfate/molybdate ABC transporter ATP-binding protein n=1 Tax=Fodinicola acaciae TaxID=2681555 RepID=UPI0013D09D6B|nr:ABC transporter ATP-binding protein [Fodinicola acaciae]
MSLSARIAVRRGTFQLDIELTAAAGEVVALLGPNGAGKSTALRTIAGLLRLDSGRIELDGDVLDDAGVRLPPHRRRIGVVFQDYLLFPHLSAVDNVAFGPRSQGVPKADARRIAAGWLDRVGVGEHAHAKPRDLSGGQAQRVALARALATEPGLLLLDEPLAALDARTRVQVRGELRRHLASFDRPAIVVTHDPLDAIVLADRLVVIEDGRVVQSGSPAEVTRRPRTDYVARLVGLNLVRGRLAADRVVVDGAELVVQPPTMKTGEVFACFRPSAVALYRERPQGSPRNVWKATVTGLEPTADGVRVDLAGPLAATSDVTAAAIAELDLVPGSVVWVSLKATEVEVYPA